MIHTVHSKFYVDGAGGANMYVHGRREQEEKDAKTQGQLVALSN